jgi:hypothetical protein
MELINRSRRFWGAGMALVLLVGCWSNKSSKEIINNHENIKNNRISVVYFDGNRDKLSENYKLINKVIIDNFNISNKIYAVIITVTMKEFKYIYKMQLPRI